MKVYIRDKYLQQAQWRWQPGSHYLLVPCLHCLPCPMFRADCSKLHQSDNRGSIKFRIYFVWVFVSQTTGNGIFFHQECVCCPSFHDVSQELLMLNAQFHHSLAVKEICQSAPRGCNQWSSECRKLYSSHKPGFSIHIQQGRKEVREKHKRTKVTLV